tara:strand:+ start:179 stop:487 length:309 start_codon:yes stop_codon:yes gene_type:complete
MAQGLKIQSNGTTTTVPINGLADMQGVVGGLIERVCSFDGVDMWANEEGLMYQLPINMKASVLRDVALGIPSFYAVVGDVLLTASKEGADVPQEIIDRLTKE